jgi:protein subunit release factor A
MMKQFELEQGIMDCWHIVDDLKVLSEAVVEDDQMTMDKVSNITIGMEELYQLKFDKLFRTFEEFLKIYYALHREVESLRHEVTDLKSEQDEIEEANALAAQESLARIHSALEKEFNPENKSLDELFLEEEEAQSHAWDEDDRIEDEFGFN